MLLLASCGPSGKTTTAPEPAKCEVGEGVPIAWETEVEDPPWNDTDADKIGAAVADGWAVYAQVEADGVIYALVGVAACVDRCEPQVLRIVDGQRTARAPVPHGDPKYSPMEAPFTVEWMALEDHTGDGAPELWVGHGMAEYNTDNDGTSYRSYVTMFDPADLKVHWSAEVSHANDVPYSTEFETDGKHDGCIAKLATVDANCDGAPDIVATATCCRAVLDPWEGEGIQREASEREEAGEEVDWDEVDAQIEALSCTEQTTERTVYQRGDDAVWRAM